jgi:hypothetical protein
MVFPPLLAAYPTKYSVFNYFGFNGYAAGFWMICALTGHLSVILTLGFTLQSYRLRLSEPNKLMRAIYEWFEMPENIRLFLDWSVFVNFSVTFSIYVNFWGKF